MRLSSSRAIRSAVAVTALVASASSAHAVITITNGNFNTYAPGQSGNVPGVYQWFNAQNATAPWFFNVSQATAVSPSGSTSVVLTGNHDPAAGVPIPWIYQSIGFNTEARSTLRLTFDLGGFTDNNPIDAHIDVMLFKATGFAGADNADILGSASAIQVGTTFSVERLGFAGNSGVITVPANFNLAGVTATDELFLRFQSTVPTGSTVSNYVRLDNVIDLDAVIRVPVDLTYVGVAAGGTFDTNTSAQFKTAANVASVFREGDNVTFENSGAVDGTGVSTVNVVGTVSPGKVTVNSSHDYVFTGTGNLVGVDATPSTAATSLVKSGTGKLKIATMGGFAYGGGTTINAGIVEIGEVYNDTTNNDTPFLGSGTVVNNGTIVINRTFDPALPTGFTKEYAPLFLRNKVDGTGSIDIKGYAFLGNPDDDLTTGVASTFTGTVLIEAGFTFLADANALGSPNAGTTVLSGATLGTVDQYHLGATATIPEPLTLNGVGVNLPGFGVPEAGGALFVFQGVRNFTGNVNLATTSRIFVNGTAEANLTGTLSAASGAGLEKAGTGTLRLKGATMDSLTVTAGTLVQTSGTMKVKSLNVVNFVGLYDVTQSTVAIDYTGTSVYANIQNGINSGDIYTSLDPTKYVLGILDNSLNAIPFTSVNGVAIDASTVIIRGALRGDFDLNGTVNFDDLLILAKNFNGTGKLYQQGDSNYSATVDFDDLLALAKNFNQNAPSGASADDFSSGFLAEFALAQSLVPEPMSLSILAAGSLLMGRRRRA